MWRFQYSQETFYNKKRWRITLWPILRSYHNSCRRKLNRATRLEFPTFEPQFSLRVFLSVPGKYCVAFIGDLMQSEGVAPCQIKKRQDNDRVNHEDYRGKGSHLT